ncbi:unnamed protein product [Brachionus calyciflorus]|uniref:Transmembrane protein n=1 Tax=Brachionus calyciflorus TaxID=104777 RepID=A0A814AC63_9BILA|nr:unnamed protein product [Brachionus calyciflorus]
MIKWDLANIEVSRVNNSDFISLLNHLFNLCLITPLTIFFWASTWDIYYTYIYPNNLSLSCLITFLITNIILILSYFGEKKFQLYLDKHDKNSRKSIIFRLFYTYFLSLAYVAQWKTYWDVLNYYTYKFDYKYFIVLSIFSLFSYRYILKNSFQNYIRTCPFQLKIDHEFYTHFFVQNKIFYSKNENLQNLSNFLYFEIVDISISLFAWKGLWDLIDIGSLYLMNGSTFKSLFLTGLLGYSLYLCLIIFQAFLIRNKMCLIRRKIIEDLVYILSYLSIVAVWRTFWNGYDYFIFMIESRELIFLVTHFGIFILMVILKLDSSLYGPGGSNLIMENTYKYNQPVGKTNFDQLFEIKYF